MNKKLIALLSALSLCVTVTACSKNDNSNSNIKKASINIESLENESISEPDTYIKLGTEITIEGQGAEVSNNKRK